MDERILNKLDKIEESIINIDKTLVKQHISLDEHIRRTALLETQLAPIQKHVVVVQGIIAFLMGCAAFAGAIKLFLVSN